MALYADECTSNQVRIPFARLLIEVDVTVPLPSILSIEEPDGKMIEQKVVYEWTPPFCKACNKVGHDCAEKGPAKKKATKQWVPNKVPAPPPQDPQEFLNLNLFQNMVGVCLLFLLLLPCLL